ncbi:hypothetical protein PpBr36_01420, partial [Pyricularia pennisetigena]|uniref:hypothetical protein n=1 Tax=Pyricularia pennisetigena TaxID=1578925 RepID=UPI00114FCDDF
MSNPKEVDPMSVISPIDGTEDNSSDKRMSHDKEKTAGADAHAAEDEHDVNKDVELQHGVAKIQAITKAWTTKYLILTYVLIYLSSYCHSMQQNMNSNLGPYVTSAFSRHGLLATVGIVARLSSGIAQIPMAKIGDIWGRMEIYILVHGLTSFGLMLMAVSNSIETYAAANVFWSVGSVGVGFIHTVLISDLTSLRNRMIIYTLNSTAYIGNAFAGPIVAELFLKKSDFRWAFGAFAIIFPFFGASICVVLWLNLRRAKRQGLVPARPSSGRSTVQSVVFYLNEFDVVGMMLLCGGFSIFLLPFSIVSYSPYGWKSAYIIFMIIFGPLLVCAFVWWEKTFAVTPLVPWRSLKDRTILGAALTAGIISASAGQVVHQQSVSQAGFISNIYTIASCTWGPIVGYLIRVTHHYKWIAMSAVPVAVLATGLLIHFRTPDTYIGYVIMCQVLKACANGTIIICEQLAVTSVVSHNQVAVMLALIGLATSVGSSIGRAISGGIWTNQLLPLLTEMLPQDQKANATVIYGSLPVQLSYPFGSPTRSAIVAAYGDVQRKMVIAGACLMPLALAAVFLWRNVNVKKTKQTAGQRAATSQKALARLKPRPLTGKRDQPEPGTGAWLTHSHGPPTSPENAKYRSWRSSRSGEVLWVRGDSATFSTEDTHTILNLVNQDGLELCPKDQLPGENTWQALKSLIRRQTSCFLVIDALDECTLSPADKDRAVPGADLMRRLTELTERTRLKLACFSRDEACLKAIMQNAACITLRADLVMSDVLTVFLREYDRDPALPPGSRERAKKRVLKTADGSFQWTRVLTQYAKSVDDVEAIDMRLEVCPPALHDAYERMLLETSRLGGFGEEETQLRSAIFAFLLAAQAPATPAMLVDALGIPARDAAAWIGRLCRPLVYVSESRVELRHASARDFLLGSHARVSDTLPPVTLAECDELLARKCLERLLRDKREHAPCRGVEACAQRQAVDQNDRARLSNPEHNQNDFYNYAAEYCITHLVATPEPAGDLLELASAFLSSLEHSQWDGYLEEKGHGHIRLKKARDQLKSVEGLN